MERVTLNELGFSSRNEAVSFLKKLWRHEETECPLCGSKLDMLHAKAKKDDCDWQCRSCSKVYRTIHLLDEINEQMKD